MNKPITAKDFFLNLGIIVTLYTIAISFINLVFQTLNYLYPDSLGYYYDPYSSSMRWAIASLVVVFPLYVFLNYLFYKSNSASDNQGGEAPTRSPIQSFLTYLTLFLAGAAIITDLIVLINHFLGGEELTARFLLKVLTIIITSGIIFWYYLLEIKGGVVKTKRKWFAVTSLILVVGAIVWGFSVMGSPYTQRQIRFDQQKINDLQNIQWQIVNYWQRKAILPKNLSDLKDEISGYVVPRDPQTGNSYEYQVVEVAKDVPFASFRLCADFNTVSNLGLASDDTPKYISGSIRPAVYIGDENWDHGVGTSCFERTIDPDRYPVSVKQ